MVRALCGRKDALASALRDALDARCPDVQSISISIGVRDTDPECYRKRLA